jgi:enoyl-CoA hydratase/carnithine racemase
VIRIEHIPVADMPERRIALILLDRPEKRNALTPDMLANIASAADLVRAGEGKADAVVLAGEGSAFCAGFDLSLCRDDVQMMPALLTRLSQAVRALRRLPIPVVIAAHGGAIAGGCALLGAGDIVVTDASAKIGYPVVNLGISPAVTSPALSQSVTGGALRRLLLDPKLITGEEAMRVGLAHECLKNPEEVRPCAIDFACLLARKPRTGVHAVKHWLNELDGSYCDERFDAALEVSLALSGGREERERLESIWTKR